MFIACISIQLISFCLYRKYHRWLCKFLNFRFRNSWTFIRSCVYIWYFSFYPIPDLIRSGRVWRMRIDKRMLVVIAEYSGLSTYYSSTRYFYGFTVLSRVQDAPVCKTHPLFRPLNWCLYLSFAYSAHPLFGNIVENQLLRNNARKPVKPISKCVKSGTSMINRISLVKCDISTYHSESVPDTHYPTRVNTPTFEVMNT